MRFAARELLRFLGLIWPGVLLILLAGAVGIHAPVLVLDAAAIAAMLAVAFVRDKLAGRL